MALSIFTWFLLTLALHLSSAQDWRGDESIPYPVKFNSSFPADLLDRSPTNRECIVNVFQPTVTSYIPSGVNGSDICRIVDLPEDRIQLIQRVINATNEARLCYDNTVIVTSCCATISTLSTQINIALVITNAGGTSTTTATTTFTSLLGNIAVTTLTSTLSSTSASTNIIISGTVTTALTSTSTNTVTETSSSTVTTTSTSTATVSTGTTTSTTTTTTTTSTSTVNTASTSFTPTTSTTTSTITSGTITTTTTSTATITVTTNTATVTTTVTKTATLIQNQRLARSVDDIKPSTTLSSFATVAPSIDTNDYNDHYTSSIDSSFIASSINDDLWN